MPTIYRLQVTSEQTNTWRTLADTDYQPQLFCPLACAAFVAGFDPLHSPTNDEPYIPTFYGTLVPITTEERHLVEEFIYQVDHDDTPPEPQTFLFTLEQD